MQRSLSVTNNGHLANFDVRPFRGAASAYGPEVLFWEAEGDHPPKTPQGLVGWSRTKGAPEGSTRHLGDMAGATSTKGRSGQLPDGATG
jgi:hypothetical protein